MIDNKCMKHFAYLLFFPLILSAQSAKPVEAKPDPAKVEKPENLTPAEENALLKLTIMQQQLFDEIEKGHPGYAVTRKTLTDYILVKRAEQPAPPPPAPAPPPSQPVKK